MGCSLITLTTSLLIMTKSGLLTYSSVMPLLEKGRGGGNRSKGNKQTNKQTKDSVCLHLDKCGLAQQTGSSVVADYCIAEWLSDKVTRLVQLG